MLETGVRVRAMRSTREHDSVTVLANALDGVCNKGTDTQRAQSRSGIVRVDARGERRRVHESTHLCVGGVERLRLQVGKQ
jgi:hypothetical protein